MKQNISEICWQTFSFHGNLNGDGIHGFLHRKISWAGNQKKIFKETLYVHGNQVGNPFEWVVNAIRLGFAVILIKPE